MSQNLDWIHLRDHHPLIFYRTIREIYDEFSMYVYFLFILLINKEEGRFAFELCISSRLESLGL